MGAAARDGCPKQIEEPLRRFAGPLVLVLLARDVSKDLPRPGLETRGVFRCDRLHRLSEVQEVVKSQSEIRHDLWCTLMIRR
jgi:hypothetical protein